MIEKFIEKSLRKKLETIEEVHFKMRYNFSVNYGGITSVI